MTGRNGSRSSPGSAGSGVGSSSAEVTLFAAAAAADRFCCQCWDGDSTMYYGPCRGANPALPDVPSQPYRDLMCSSLASFIPATLVSRASVEGILGVVRVQVELLDSALCALYTGSVLPFSQGCDPQNAAKGHRGRRDAGADGPAHTSRHFRARLPWRANQRRHWSVLHNAQGGRVRVSTHQCGERPGLRAGVRPRWDAAAHDHRGQRPRSRPRHDRRAREFLHCNTL